MSGRAKSPLGKSIILVGMMGAGKSSVGRRLATRLGLPFVDADKEIEAAAGRSIEDIFANHGEEAFRAGERRVIARLLDGQVQVVATGGGAFMDKRTRAKIRQKAISVWLRTDIETILDRVERRNDRPLLKDGDPREIVENLLRERDPIYERADITVESGGRPLGVTVDHVVAALEKKLGGPLPRRATAWRRTSK